MPERLDRIQIELTNGTVTIPWTSRDALLGEFRTIDSMESIRRKFRALGASRPLTLDQQEKRELVNVIHHWADTTEGGYTKLPDGVLELRNELIEDLER
jgi:hypothetical protein